MKLATEISARLRSECQQKPSHYITCLTMTLWRLHLSLTCHFRRLIKLKVRATSLNPNCEFTSWCEGSGTDGRCLVCSRRRSQVSAVTSHVQRNHPPHKQQTRRDRRK
ncbi:hypothetical protein JOB18_002165 [Solea senegalensis]|uniref:Uncharacterized protein n=1 Tax=Solea senegalensis TaxID=28829 RepID=A0AAV6QBQ1_SOLSE|nr:hypothetical protein JOB18_002165 [Solea senegalensis]